MNYMEHTEAWLDDRLRLVCAVGATGDEDADAIIADVKREIQGKIRESYRNGKRVRAPRGGLMWKIICAVQREVGRQVSHAPRHR